MVSIGSKYDQIVCDGCGEWVNLIGLLMLLLLFDCNQGNIYVVQSCVDQVCDLQCVILLCLCSEVVQVYDQLCILEQELVLVCCDLLFGVQSVLDLMICGFEMGKFNFFDVFDVQCILVGVCVQYVCVLDVVVQVWVSMECLFGEDIGYFGQ